MCGAGGVQHRSVLDFATQCLQNAIYLCEQAAERSTSLQHTPADMQSLHDALSNPGGLSYPGNGHRGGIGAARGGVEQGSAAEAAEQLAMLSLDRSRASSGMLC